MSASDIIIWGVFYIFCMIMTFFVVMALDFDGKYTNTIGKRLFALLCWPVIIVIFCCWGTWKGFTALVFVIKTGDVGNGPSRTGPM